MFKFSIVLVFCVICLQAHTQLPAYVPAGGLVGWYDFSGNANDASPTGNNGIIFNAVLANDRFGNPNSAYYFNGTNAYIECLNTPMNYTQGYSFSAWVQSDLSSYVDMNVFGQLGPAPSCNTTNTNSSFGISGSGCYRLRHRREGIPGVQNCTLITVADNVITNDWVHLVLTWDRDTLRGYKNGALIGVLAMDNNSPPGPTLRIGNGSTNATPVGFFFQGRIDDAGVWNRPLTSQEVEQLYLADETYQTSSVTTVFSCDSYTWPANNQTYTSSGFYSHTYTTQVGCDSTVTLNLTINTCNPNLCAAIDTNLCYASQPYPVVDFAIEKKFDSADSTSLYQSPLLADIDGDCIPEIISSATTGFQTNPRLISGIRIINSQTGQTINTFPTAFYGWDGGTSFVVADVNFDGQAEFIVAAANNPINPPNIAGRLVCYDLNGQVMWISNEPFGINATHIRGGSPALADFNKDGIPEVYIYNEIFNAQTGVKLCDGGANGIGLGDQLLSIGSLSISIAADLDNDLSDLELAAGYTIYKVSIPNLNGFSGNSMTAHNIMVDGLFRDGFTSIADINQDGQLDVIVSSPGNFPEGKIYVYTMIGASPQFLASASPPSVTVAESCSTCTPLIGPPFIGDIDGSGVPSIGITRALRLITYQYDGTTQLNQNWIITTNDRSGRTGMTMFDFNQDGIQEIVYRDETTLRIINGSVNPPQDLASIACFSGTGTEHPIVGDIDNSGESKICVTCGTAVSGLSGQLGKVTVFGAPDGQQPWAPSRGVWNQYAYHVFNVNDDLTIPAQQLNNATYANGAYNHFYVQASLLDENGNFLQQVPDLGGEIECVNYDWNTNEYTISFSISNAANASLSAPSGISVAFFDGNPQTNGNLLGTAITTTPINQGDTLNNLSFTFTSSNLTELYMVVNADGSITGLPYTENDFTILECGYTNNIISTQNLPLIEELSDTICANQSYDHYGTIYTETGTYFFTAQDENGCDSLVSKLNLIVNPIYEFSESIVACDTFVWLVNGQTYTSTGIYTEVLQTQFGCDSTLILDLTINESVTTTETVSSCDAFTWSVNGQTYTNSGTYTEVLQTQLGCDSTLLLELTINESISSTETVSICDSYTWPLNGQTYTSSGTHTEVLQTQLGCDSTVILNLTILLSNGSQTSITACDSYTWNGQTYAQSGTYTFQTVNIAGCDSIAALNLTIHNSAQTQEIIQVCEWEDENILEFAFTTIHGCDSIHTVIYERYPQSQLPISSFSTSPTTTVLLPPGVIQTFNSSQNANTYLWNFGDGSGTATETNPTHTYQNEGQYEISLVVNNNTNCPDSSVQLIIVQEDLLIYVPNAFTPDGDNFNPLFLPIISGDFDPYNYSLLIFNHWGEVVFESRNAEVGWDGTYGGKIVQDGTYIWKIRLQSKSNDEPREFVGHVTVLR